MLTNGMTMSEVRSVIHTDMTEIFKFLKNRENNYRRTVLKSSKFPLYFEPYHFTSSGKNEWILIIEASDKKAIQYEKSKITSILLMNTKVGYYVYMPTLVMGKFHIAVFPPHFFSRYRERMNMNYYGKKLITEYFIRNSSFVFDHKSTIYDNIKIIEVAASSNDGVGLGYVLLEGDTFLKTFITYEMLKGEQIEKYTENEKIRKEIHDKFF